MELIEIKKLIKSKFNEEAIMLSEQITVHASGEMPTGVIIDRRPHESDYVKEYREKIYKSKPKGYINRIFNTLEKIQRSPEWGTTFKDFPPKISEKGNLNYLMNNKIINYKTVDNFLFSNYLRSYLLDSNGVVLIDYSSPESNDYGYFNLEFIKSKDVIYSNSIQSIVRDGEYFKHYEKSEQGSVLTILKLSYINQKEELIIVDQINLPTYPIIKCKAIFKKIVDGQILNESRIQCVVDDFDEAAREYSDMQGAVVNYLHPERWEYATENCKSCNVNGISTGYINVNGEQKVCGGCQGMGKVGTATGVYQKVVLRPANKQMGEQDTVSPPFGYVTKETALFELLEKRIDKHLYNGLCAVNMQFLDKSPISQSGVAKEVDRDELNTFVYSVAEDLVYMKDVICSVMIDYAYHIILGEQRHDYKPINRVPQKFDLIGSDYMLKEINELKGKNVNPVVLAEMESEFFEKRFFENPEKVELMKATVELNPFYGQNPEVLMIAYGNGAIDKLQYYISQNINRLIKLLIEQNNFYGKSISEKRTLIEALASSELNKNVIPIDTRQV